MSNFMDVGRDEDLLQFIDLDKDGENEADLNTTDVSPLSGLDGDLDMRSDMSNFYDAQMGVNFEGQVLPETEKPLLERWKDRITAAMTPNFGPIMSSYNTSKSAVKTEESQTLELSQKGSSNESARASSSSNVDGKSATNVYITNMGYSESYRQSQVKLSNMEFGRAVAVDALDDPLVNIETGISNWDDLLIQHANTKYKYQLFIGEFPKRSRVETQIKCRVVFSPSPEEHLVHLPPDTIARPRFQLANDFKPTPDTIQLSVDVISPTSPEKALFMCHKCMNREKKRAFRKKNLDPNEENHWCETRSRRLAIFNCREVISFPLAKACDIGNGQVIEGREIELPLRLACYCRHHPAKEGFRVIFTARDFQGSIVGRAISDSILITDDHKESKTTGGSYLRNNQSSSTHLSSYSASGSNTGPPSPVSMEESSDYSSSTSYKRRRESDWAGSTRNSVSSSAVFQRLQEVGSPSSSDGGLNFKVNPSIAATNAATSSSSTNLSGAGAAGNPMILRVIPSQGSIRGGIEVTLLGRGFQNGMTATFGGVKSVSTHCWNDSTMVTQLPPAAQAGPVLVGFEGIASSSPQMFTYVDDTDRQLIELALQVVGLKMNGKLEDARNIAMRIVGTNTQGGSAGTGSTAVSPEDGNNTSFNISADKHEEVILRCISLADLKQGLVPNWQLRNTEGQTLMHLAAILGYTRVISSLVGKGARIDIQDLNGMTAIHFAALHGQRRAMDKLLKHHADPYQSSIIGKNAFQLLGAEQQNETFASPLDTSSHMSYYMHSRRRSSTSTMGSSDTNSIDRFAKDMCSVPPHPGVFAETNDYTDSGELDLDWESGNDDDIWDDSGVADPSKPGDAAQRMFTHYEGRNVPPRIQQKRNAAEYLSSYLQQLTANARNRINWDQWDQLIGKRHLKPLDIDDHQAEGSRTATSASESDTTTVGGTAGVSVARVWQYLTQQELAARRSSPGGVHHHPPAYDDIFPRLTANSEFRREKTPQNGEVELSLELEQEQQQEEDFEQRFVNTWMTNRKQLKNDMMLFFFWLPVFLLAVLYVSRLIGQGGTDTWQETVRQWLGNAVLGRRARQTLASSVQVGTGV